MKRRSFIASLFAVTAAPVVAKAVAAKAVPVVGKIEGPESVGRYEAVEPIVLDHPLSVEGPSSYLPRKDQPDTTVTISNPDDKFRQRVYDSLCDTRLEEFDLRMVDGEIAGYVSMAFSGYIRKLAPKDGGHNLAIGIDVIGVPSFTLIANANPSALHTAQATEALR